MTKPLNNSSSYRIPSSKIKKINGESFRQSLIIKYLCKIPNSRLLRLYNCPPFSAKAGKFVRRSTSLTPNGLPDLLFISQMYGVHFFEVKSESAYKKLIKNIGIYRRSLDVKDSNHHVKKQIKLIDELNMYGCVNAHFVSTVDHVVAILKKDFEIEK